MDPKNFTVRVELSLSTPEKLIQVEDVLMSLEFVGFATKKGTEMDWLFPLPAGLYFGQSTQSAEAISRQVSHLLQEHELECRVFVSEVVDWFGTDMTRTIA